MLWRLKRLLEVMERNGRPMKFFRRLMQLKVDVFEMWRRVAGLREVQDCVVRTELPSIAFAFRLQSKSLAWISAAGRAQPRIVLGQPRQSVLRCSLKFKA